MRLVTLDATKLKGYLQDKEMLYKAKRPCALIVKMTYKGHRYDFAIPMRSNIVNNAPKDQYFPLPPRRTTKPTNHHGLHYIKMFPIKRQWTLKYHTNDMFSAIVKSIIDKNEKQIINECKAYLANYENGIKPNYSTDIDLLIQIMSQTP